MKEAACNKKTADVIDEVADIHESTDWLFLEVVPEVYSLPFSIEDQGFCFTFSRYITPDFLPNGTPEYTTTKFWKIASHNELARDVVISIGLAALSNTRQDLSLMVDARRRFSTVLHSTQTALKDPEYARSDKMLGAVMMLWLFEVKSQLLGTATVTDLDRSSLVTHTQRITPWVI
jgi:hypothetical protein